MDANKDHKINLFHKHFTKAEKISRNKTISLLNNPKCQKDLNHYTPYLKTKKKSIEIENYNLDDVVNQLTKIKNELPKNAANVGLCSFIKKDEDDSPFGYGEKKICVDWIEYTIEDESKCSSLALYRAKNSVFKMKYQSDSIDGKKALELYKKLKEQKN